MVPGPPPPPLVPAINAMIAMTTATTTITIQTVLIPRSFMPSVCAPRMRTQPLPAELDELGELGVRQLGQRTFAAVDHSIGE
ncbi:hypothetical protein GCM10022234_30080 [Aeromicrobium panaciterrae]